MTRNNHNAPATAHLVRHWRALLACVALLCAPAARALDTGDIVIVSFKGDVHVTMKGTERAVRAGAVLETPASVRTGRDGAIELRQGATSVSVGPDTLLEFPELAERGGPIDRIVQPRGNAFYDIGKRPGRKLRVETPWLVGVVKGTQFNVAVQDEATTISLFEGLLEIRSSDESSKVDIHAGEIATRRRGDAGIGVIKMDAGKAPAPPSRSESSNADAADSVLAERGDDARPVTGRRDPPAIGAVLDEVAAGIPAVVGPPDVPRAPVDVGAGTSLEAGASAPAVDVAASTGVDVGPAGPNVDVGVSTGVDVGAAPAVDVNVGAAVDVGGPGVTASVDLGASAGLDNVAAVDAGVGAGVDLGNTGAAASVDVNAGVDAGPLSTDAGAGVAVDLGGGGGAATVDLGAGADIGGAAAVDAGADAAVNVAPADVAANVDVGASVAGVDAGASVGADLGSGNVDLGVNVAGVNLGVGLDLGLDQDDQGEDTGNTDAPGDTDPAPGNDDSNVVTDVVTDVVDDVGGLLNGLLKKPRKR
ncbi:MAG TPA: FecR domain-containing protein [Steroidobacteraceae bacterium]|nr:FecR domain-containing protein [Steroidobacteraceae bacterium]